MSYDWKKAIKHEPFSREWFDESDRRFVHAARLFAHAVTPFDKIIPFERLRGKKVLEIGCGMGYHTELMTRAGAIVTSIDISDTSVMATKARLSIKGLGGDVVQMDARQMNFADNSFDFVWSWGVIHHSAWTCAIVKEISRVLKEGGQSRVMVYNLNGMSAYISIVRDYLGGFWRGRTLDACLWKRSDGFMARYYTADILSDVFLCFFRSADVNVYGQDADAVPLPRYLRRPLLRVLSETTLVRLIARRGGFLFVIANK